MSSATSKKTSERNMKYMALTAIFAAIVTIMTAYVFHIPVSLTGGYIHFGDGIIYIAACLLPKPYAMAAGAIGGGLADLLTAPMWTIPTVIVKMLITVPFTSKQKNMMNTRNIIAAVLAYFISATGYYLAETLVFGYEVAFITSYLGSLAQSAGSLAIFVIFGLALDKVQVKKRLSL